jgi:hypothetical protein
VEDVYIDFLYIFMGLSFVIDRKSYLHVLNKSFIRYVINIFSHSVGML